ncbi:MAG: hypothetical protein N2554_02160 [Fimbriimonadales bacterium]|nr:hypothetical protein [Fimbriimonadales bacterium]
MRYRIAAMLRWVFCLGIGGALLLALWGQPPVELKVQPLLGASPAANGAFPLAVQLESKSRNYQGVLSVTVGGFGYRREYQYPIDLPAGSRKVVVATPIVSRFGDLATVRFTARGVNLEVQQRIERVLDIDQLAVLVGDLIGGLGVLEQVQTAENPAEIDYRTNRLMRGKYRVAYCRPDLFPEQAIALSGAQVIVLGPGSERLRAEQWDALRRWVMLGGVLIAPGGAGAVYLQIPALQALLPVQTQGTQTVSQLRALGDWVGARPPVGAATVSQARLKTGAIMLQQDGLPLIAIRPYGLGTVVFLAFNPLDAPLRDYNARARFWQRLLNQTPSFPPSFSIAATHQNQGGYDRWGQAQIATDIELRPPSVALIIVLLSLYFLLVVPVNYWTLKRLRALDWAWVVTPLIALGFVGVLWRLAGDLYRKSLSSKVQTLIVAQAGSPDAYAINSALFFFPRAGLFDLRFDQSDMVEAGMRQDFGAGAAQVPTVRTVQGEPTRVESYRVSNLSFQWFRYTRIVQLEGQVEGILRVERRNGGMRLSGVLRSRLPYALTNAQILTPFGKVQIENLSARGSVRLSDKPLEPLTPPLYDFSDWGWYQSVALSPESLASFLLQRREFKGSAILTAQASEPVLPPEVGDAAEQAAQVAYLISFPLEGAKP